MFREILSNNILKYKLIFYDINWRFLLIPLDKKSFEIFGHWPKTGAFAFWRNVSNLFRHFCLTFCQEIGGLPKANLFNKSANYKYK